MRSPAPVCDCLIVDDDPASRGLLARRLGEAGLSSAGVSGIGELGDFLHRRHPTLVLLDVMLGDSDAVDALRLLRDHGFRGAVRLISGLAPWALHEIKAIGERHGLRMLEPLRKPLERRAMKGFARPESARTEPIRRATSALKSASPDTLSASELDAAIDSGRLIQHYQQKVDLLSGTTIGAEALVRIDDPDCGIIPPAGFLDSASDAQLRRITELVITGAMRDWSRLDAAGSPIRLSVNVPVVALVTMPLAKLVRETRPKSANWRGMTFEITETESIADAALAAEIALQLRLCDVDFAIDDFGTGYSSFARLKELPFAELKLDRRFVQQFAENPVDLAICRSAILLARMAGARVVAEGIETPEETEALAAMGCDLGQGYFFGRPMALDRLIERVRRIPRASMRRSV